MSNLQVYELPVRSGVRSVRHLHEHMLWDGDATGVLLRQWSSGPSRHTQFGILLVNNNTVSQLRHHKVRAAQVWWLNLIELATVSIIHTQKIVNINILSYDETATGLLLWTQSIASQFTYSTFVADTMLK